MHPVFSSFCFGCLSLRYGTLIISLLSVVFHVVAFLKYINFFSEEEKLYDGSGNTWVVVIHTVRAFVSILLLTGTWQVTQFFSLGVCQRYGACNKGCSIDELKQESKRIPRCLLPWLLTTAFSVCFEIFQIFYLAWTHHNQGVVHTIVVQTILLTIDMYILFVVYSYYCELISENDLDSEE